MLGLNTNTGGASSLLASKRRNAVSSSSVLCKITCTDIPTGEKVNQFGGVEAYLSIITGLGPCLVVRGARHKRGEGTYFQLRLIEQIFNKNIGEGKLSIQVPHQKRKLLVFIDASKDPESIPHLILMSNTIEQPRRWSDLEVNLGRGPKKGRGRGSGGGGGGATAGGVEDGEAAVMQTNKTARDQLLGLNNINGNGENNENLNAGDDDDDPFDEMRNQNATTKEKKRSKKRSKAANSIHDMQQEQILAAQQKQSQQPGGGDDDEMFYE